MDSSKKWGFMGIRTAVRLFTISEKQEQSRAAMVPVDALAFLSACRSGYKVAWQVEWMIFSLESSLARPMIPNLFMWPIYPAQLFENVRWRKWSVTRGLWYWSSRNYLCTITSTNSDGLRVQLSMCLHTWQLAHLINSINISQAGDDPMLALHRPMLLERLQLWYWA